MTRSLVGDLAISGLSFRTAKRSPAGDHRHGPPRTDNLLNPVPGGARQARRHRCRAARRGASVICGGQVPANYREGHTAMRITLEIGDITAQQADAVVNAANSSLLGGGGVDGAIHRRGGPAILAACRELRASQFPDGLPPGQAVATTAGDLPARWVIHTVGPVYSSSEDRSAVLASCYAQSLRVADELGAA